MSLLDRLTTKHKFPDGATLRELHRYALRFELGNRSVDIGFEQALEHGVDRLIHEESVVQWNGSNGEAVTPEERAAIIDRVRQYCAVKGLTYRIVSTSVSV